MLRIKNIKLEINENESVLKQKIINILKTGDAIKIHKQENEVYTSSKIHEVISSEFKVKDILKIGTNLILEYKICIVGQEYYVNFEICFYPGCGFTGV